MTLREKIGARDNDLSHEDVTRLLLALDTLEAVEWIEATDQMQTDFRRALGDTAWRVRHDPDTSPIRTKGDAASFIEAVATLKAKLSSPTPEREGKT